MLVLASLDGAAAAVDVGAELPSWYSAPCFCCFEALGVASDASDGACLRFFDLLGVSRGVAAAPRAPLLLVCPAAWLGRSMGGCAGLILASWWAEPAFPGSDDLAAAGDAAPGDAPAFSFNGFRWNLENTAAPTCFLPSRLFDSMVIGTVPSP